jgi:16S rRNA (cytosine967-C5)-methyltransferase
MADDDDDAPAKRPDLDRLYDRRLASQVISGGRLRGTLLELWQRTRMDWGFVTDRLSATFRKEKWIGAQDRRFVGETLFGLVRHLRRVDLALTRATRVTRPPRDLDRVLTLLVLERLIDPARAAQVSPELDWNAALGVDAAIAAERKVDKRIALAASMPDWLAARLVADWGAAAEPLAHALNERAPMTVRANLLVGDRAALARELATAGLTTRPGLHCDTALHIESRTNLFALEAFTRGALEAQDEGSQLLADLAVPPASAGGRPTVVDLCAGAGGKTLAIAARLGNRGRILASDIDGHKLDELRRRARRATVSNAQAVKLEGTNWPPALEALRGKADVVLVDAPCSGIGALRRNPEARWRLREADLADFAARQRQILSGARELCAPGGRIVYGTCTILRTENQDVVAATLASHADLEAVPLREVLGEERATALGDGDAFLVTPARHGTDGFFAQVLRRNPS